MARIKLRIQRPWIPYIIFVVTLILTLIATFYVNEVTYTQDKFRFTSSVLDTNTNVRTQLETYIALLRGTAGLFAAESNLNEDEFTNYVNRLNIQINYAGAMGLGFVQKVNKSDLDSFNQSTEQDNEQLTVHPEGNRDEYDIVRFLTRKDKKVAASLGYDMNTNPIYKKAMDLARDKGSSYASGKVLLIDKPTHQKVTLFIIFTPVYQDGDIPKSIQDRRNKIIGYVFIPFNINALLKQIFGNRAIPELLNFQIYDNNKAENENLLFDNITNNSIVATEGFPKFKETRSFISGGNTWLINYTNSAQFDLESEKNIPTIIFIGGLLVSLMFFMLSRSQYLARANAEIAANKLQSSQKELQKAINHRDNFISIASHELKTPLTSLKVYAEVLLRQFNVKDDEKTVDYLIKINRQIDKLTMLIQDLLDVSRIQTNQLTFREEKFDMNDMVKEVIENVQQIADHHKIELVGSIKRKILGDKERLGQVLMNLLTNAIKYSPKANKIIVTLQEKNQNAIVSVKDFGIGIDKEHQKKIFDRFYRISDTQGRTFPGLGIGLYISSAIVKRHGGEISIISRLGHGSIFQFALPYKRKRSNGN